MCEKTTQISFSVFFFFLELLAKVYAPMLQNHAKTDPPCMFPLITLLLDHLSKTAPQICETMKFGLMYSRYP